MRPNTFCHSERMNLGTSGAPQRSRERVLLIISLRSTLFLVVDGPAGAAAPDDAQLRLQHSGGTAMAACSCAIESGKFTGRALADFYISRATIWQTQHQFNRCLEDLNQAMKLDPTWATPMFDRASIYLQQGQYDRAVEDFDPATKIEPMSRHSDPTAKGKTHLSVSDSRRTQYGCNHHVARRRDRAISSSLVSQMPDGFFGCRDRGMYAGPCPANPPPQA
jgi:Tetratricopeptide repeat